MKYVVKIQILPPLVKTIKVKLMYTTSVKEANISKTCLVSYLDPITTQNDR